jgi:hypothetical protein
MNRKRKNDMLANSVHKKSNIINIKIRCRRDIPSPVSRGMCGGKTKNVMII